jgi:hypothetical protein
MQSILLRTGWVIGIEVAASLDHSLLCGSRFLSLILSKLHLVGVEPSAVVCASTKASQEL